MDAFEVVAARDRTATARRALTPRRATAQDMETPALSSTGTPSSPRCSRCSALEAAEQWPQHAVQL